MVGWCEEEAIFAGCSAGDLFCLASVAAHVQTHRQAALDAATLSHEDSSQSSSGDAVDGELANDRVGGGLAGDEADLRHFDRVELLDALVTDRLAFA